MTTREQVWSAAFNAVANASNSVSKDTAIEWADECLGAFDKRFKQEATEKAEGKLLYREPGEPYISAGSVIVTHKFCQECGKVTPHDNYGCRGDIEVKL